ncbi:6-hydroxy-D-nicotine oxidase [Cytospora mali]|uniref:6-hydroxy-D-nicotine oxidase n=1 Tax=Cytospora mali TaxID=578113 RepID=A0A194V6U0_CYTMA|nr:6-hydroxy-D-nicotine oxidase [Valsa mali var. pyri (nom. inval.)]
MTIPVHRIINYEGISPSVLASDAPTLAGLLDENPGLLVYTHSSPHFTTVSSPANPAVKHKPLAVIRPLSEDPVSHVVRFCVSQSIPISVRSGGHDMLGRSVIHQGVVLDMRSMDWVRISEDRKSAVIGAGVLGSAVQRTCDAEGLFTPTGWCTSVGYAGWALAGGYGSFNSGYGLGVDQILGARVVTANGKFVDTDDDPELLWALRGAGSGSFGVVTEFRIKVYPKPRLFGGLLIFPLSDVRTLFAGMEAIINGTGMPEQFSGDTMVIPMQGSYALMFVFAWVLKGDDDLPVAKAFLEKLCSFGTVLTNNVAEVTPNIFAAMFDQHGEMYPMHSCNRLLTQYGAVLADILAENPPSQDGDNIVLHYSHGLAAQPNSGTSFTVRRPHIVMAVGTRIPEDLAVEDAESHPAVTSTMELMRKLDASGIVLPGTYYNFAPQKDCVAEEMFGEDGVKRLMALKEKYDSGGVFCRGILRA